MLNQYIKYIEDDDDFGEEYQEDLFETVLDIIELIFNETRQRREQLAQQVTKRFRQLCEMQHIDPDDALSFYLDAQYSSVGVNDVDIIDAILFGHE
jgi:hypothetical protein